MDNRVVEPSEQPTYGSADAPLADLITWFNEIELASQAADAACDAHILALQREKRAMTQYLAMLGTLTAQDKHALHCYRKFSPAYFKVAYIDPPSPQMGKGTGKVHGKGTARATGAEAGATPADPIELTESEGGAGAATGGGTSGGDDRSERKVEARVAEDDDDDDDDADADSGRDNADDWTDDESGSEAS